MVSHVEFDKVLPQLPRRQCRGSDAADGFGQPDAVVQDEWPRRATYLALDRNNFRTLVSQILHQRIIWLTQNGGYRTSKAHVVTDPSVLSIVDDGTPNVPIPPFQQSAEGVQIITLENNQSVVHTGNVHDRT